jgi:crotonobetaine/carnitine-CoA ligase
MRRSACRNGPDALSGFEGRDIRTLIDAQALQRGSHPFLIWQPFDAAAQTWTYAEFRDAVRRFAAGLHARGIQPGQRLLVHFDNCPEFLTAWLGCAYAGVVAVTTNAHSTQDELAYYARHSVAVGAVTQPSLAARVAGAVPHLTWIAVSGTDGGVVPEADTGAFEAFESIGGDPAFLPARPYDPAAPFGIQYTSGTTARPKAVLWSHANFLWGAQVSALHEDLRPEDVHLVHLPLFHTNAQIYSVAASLWAGATVVLQPRFSASRFWPVSLRHRCTWSSMVPFCARALAAHPVPAAHDYRYFGGPVCEPPTDRPFGVKSIGWWGMTETVTHGAVGSPHLADAPLSMGRPSPAYEILVLDAGLRPVRPGETGDLYVRGRRGVSLFVGYAGDPEATEAAFTDDGLFITGDRVRLGENGFLYFADRAKDMLKVGGENVAASEIERVIREVAGVSEVAVVGRGHPMLDEVPVAFVLPSSPGDPDLAARITAACASGLASFKQPHEVRVVESLPRAALDKVAKSELRKIVAAEFGDAAGLSQERIVNAMPPC